VKSVVAGIIESGRGQILLAQRPPGKKLAGLWEFPGGKVEKGESREQALKRELQEELELDVRIEKFLGSFPYNYPDHSIELHVFRVTALSEAKVSEEVQRFVWVQPSEVSRYELAPADVVPFQTYLKLAQCT
jgi:8-oxo-dGTP diphosphatase